MRSLIKAGLVALVLCLAAPVAAGPFENGVAAAERGDYATALWHLLADQGAAEAQTNLGKMYKLGKGVPQDFTLALTRDLDQEAYCAEASEHVGVR
jgi:hypothetical protein